MFRITADWLRRTNRCLRLSKSILIIPRMEPTRADMIVLRKIVQTDKSVRKVIPSYQLENLDLYKPSMLLDSLKDAYKAYCNDFADGLSGNKSKRWRDPEWIKKHPPSVQATLRYESVHTNRYSWLDEVYGFSNPYLGFKYVLFMKHMVGDIASAAKIYRQHNHPQLSSKSDVPSEMLNLGFWTRRSMQTRLIHEEDVFVLNTLAGFNLRDSLSMHDRRNLGAGGLVHDSQMPLLGDEVVEIDPPAFCEVANIHNLFADGGWRKVKKKHRLSNKRIAEVVRGEGIMGDIGDKNDKIGYTALDTKYLVDTYAESPYLKKIPWLRKLCDLVNSNPDLFTVWDCIGIRNGRVFFSDPRRVGNLLTVRATMFRNVYYGKYSRSTGTILTKSAVAFQYERGFLKRDDFYTMTLEEIDTRIGNFVGQPNIMRFGDRPGNPRVETFTTLKEAYRREKELFDSGIVLSAIEDVRGKIKPATHFLVQTPEGQILPFVEACPIKAEIIHKICHIPRPIYVMYLQDLQIPQESYQGLWEWKREQFAQRGQIT